MGSELWTIYCKRNEWSLWILQGKWTNQDYYKWFICSFPLNKIISDKIGSIKKQLEKVINKVICSLFKLKYFATSWPLGLVFQIVKGENNQNHNVRFDNVFVFVCDSRTSELSVKSSLSFLLGISIPELCIDPWSMSWDWEKSCISLSVGGCISCAEKENNVVTFTSLTWDFRPWK